MYDALPKSVQKWAGLDTDDPKVFDPTREQKRYLTGINDTGTSFAEIADLIEKSL